METDTDWAVQAGLKEEPKPRLLDHYAKYMPSLSELASGAFLIALGLLSLRGGGVAIRTGPDAEVMWIVENYTLPSVVAGLVIYIGVDTAIFKGRLTVWMAKIVTPVINGILKATIGEERLKTWAEKLNRRFGQKSVADST